jgi:hypothetical protein
VNRGYATAAVEALVTKAREASHVRRIAAHTPLERPQTTLRRAVSLAGQARPALAVDGANNLGAPGRRGGPTLALAASEWRRR